MSNFTPSKPTPVKITPRKTPNALFPNEEDFLEIDEPKLDIEGVKKPHLPWLEAEILRGYHLKSLSECETKAEKQVYYNSILSYIKFQRVKYRNLYKISKYQAKYIYSDEYVANGNLIYRIAEFSFPVNTPGTLLAKEYKTPYSLYKTPYIYKRTEFIDDVEVPQWIHMKHAIDKDINFEYTPKMAKVLKKKYDDNTMFKIRNYLRLIHPLIIAELNLKNFLN